jgi:hypothetical protein
MESQHLRSLLQQAIDVTALAKNTGAIDISVSPQETQEDADHRRWKDRIIFLFAVSGLALLFLLCLGILAFGGQSLDEKKIWMGVLVSLVTAMIGFALGKKS